MKSESVPLVIIVDLVKDLIGLGAAGSLSDSIAGSVPNSDVHGLAWPESPGFGLAFGGSGFPKP